ncbi:MAG: hypothetical protein ACYTG7_07085 [Planctomycetota bacterium]
MKNASKVLSSTILVLAILLPTAACGRRSLERPEEVLSRIELDYPSVLGYVRFSADTLSGVRPLSEAWDLMKKEAGSGLHNRFGFIQADPMNLLFPFMDLIAPLCRPGSHITVILIDPGVYGGAVALHFDHSEAGAFLDALDRDARFERLKGAEPPEFKWKKERDFHERLAGLLNALGVLGSFEEFKGFDRIVVDETARGTLVMPSFDVRGDFKQFLQDTDYLSPFGDAGIVVNVELLRLAQAYSEVIEGWHRSYHKLLTRLEQMLGEKLPTYAAVIRVARFMPTMTLEWLKALKGIRYVSKMPESNKPELQLLTTDGRFMADLLSCLQEDELDMVGLLPMGAAFQYNIDPSALAGLLKRGFDFFADESDLDSPEMAKDVQSAMMAMARDKGQYLAGFGYTPGGVYLALFSALEGEGSDGDAGEPAAPLESLLHALLPDMDFPVKTLEGGGGWRIEIPLGANVWPVLPELAVETAMSGTMRVTAFQIGSGFEPGDLTQRLLRLSHTGAPRVQNLPERAVMALRIALLGPLASFVPGIEKAFPQEIIGYGFVEGCTLSVQFQL